MPQDKDQSKLVTVAIHTYEKAQILQSLLQSQGIPATLHNVNTVQPIFSTGVRVRIAERDLPRALAYIEDLKWDLDEATSFADSENEYLMQEALSELVKDKTVIMIANIDELVLVMVEEEKNLNDSVFVKSEEKFKERYVAMLDALQAKFPCFFTAWLC